MGGMRKLDLTFGSLGNMTSPRHAITTTNLNHSEVPDYKTNFYEILLGSIDYLHDQDKYNKFVAKSKKIVQKYPNKKIILSVRGIASRKITSADFRLLCEAQADIGLSPIRLFFRHNLHKEFSQLLNWAINKFGSDYEYVLDHNTNLKDFVNLYLDALTKKHQTVYFINRIPTKNNKDKFVFIQGRTNDGMLRWISLLNKKASGGSLNPLYYYWLGYDVTGFNTRLGFYQVPPTALEVIKGFKYVLASTCSNDPCVIVPTNTLAQSIHDYGLQRKDSVPCSAFSIVELNTNYENFARITNPQIILSEIQNEIAVFNSL